VSLTYHEHDIIPKRSRVRYPSTASSFIYLRACREQIISLTSSNYLAEYQTHIMADRIDTSAEPAHKKPRLSPPSSSSTTKATPSGDLTAALEQNSNHTSEVNGNHPDTNAPDSLISATDAIAYWSSTSADVNGMLGGYPEVSRADIAHSRTFLAKVARLDLKRPATTATPSNGEGEENGRGKKRFRRVVDCGAGIGRVTLNFLSDVAETVDVVEPVRKFTDVITSGEGFGDLRDTGVVRRVWNAGLETWDPSKEPDWQNERQRREQQDGDEEPDEVNGHAGLAKGDRYDIIWTQWCVGQLTDTQLVEYLKRSQAWIVPGNGLIVVKENLSNDPLKRDIFDETDSSVTRTTEKFQSLFKEAGLRVVRTELQRGFPVGLYPVRMYALRPSNGS